MVSINPNHINPFKLSNDLCKRAYLAYATSRYGKPTVYNPNTAKLELVDPEIYWAKHMTEEDRTKSIKAMIDSITVAIRGWV